MRAGGDFVFCESVFSLKIIISEHPASKHTFTSVLIYRYALNHISPALVICTLHLISHSPTKLNQHNFIHKFIPSHPLCTDSIFVWKQMAPILQQPSPSYPCLPFGNCTLTTTSSNSNDYHAFWAFASIGATFVLMMMYVACHIIQHRRVRDLGY